MNNIITKAFKFSLSEASEEDGAGRFSGHATVFQEMTDDKKILDRGCLSDSIHEWKASGRMLPMFYEHDNTKILGGFNPANMREDNGSLWVEGQINLDTQLGRETYSHLKKGFLTGMSIGSILKNPSEDASFSDDGITHLKKLSLYEISVTAMPAVKSAQVVNVMSSNRSVNDTHQDTSYLSNLEMVNINLQLMNLNNYLREHLNDH